MDQSFIQQIPVSFSLNRRTHSVSSWKELVHELLEDLFASLDKDGERLAEAKIPETNRKVIYRDGYPGKFIRLSNGLQLPSDYTEQEYALLCRIICICYNITPCEMSIAYAESPEFVILSDEPDPKSASSIEPQMESRPVIEEEESTKPEIESSFTEFERNLHDDFQIEPNHGSFNHISCSEEKWLKLMLEKEAETKPSDRIRVTAYRNDEEVEIEPETWDDIISKLQHDSQALAAAKLMKKAGIPAPIMNYRGIKEHNKIGGEALFVWMDEGVAYLHGRQKYSRGYFYERGFDYVVMDDPRELMDSFRKLEADHE
ncbi:MAG: hypothetical protein IJI41_03815 [Anaerolineaceae bacterium]|nr:hypothetical protein [Anaerolineaceae bacterium]